MLFIGLIANLLVRPLAPKWFMTDAEVKEIQKKQAGAEASVAYGSYGIDKGRFDAPAMLAWAAVAIPVIYGCWFTLTKTAALFGG
jgi:hypothetical protein